MLADYNTKVHIKAEDFGEDLERMIGYVLWVTVRIKEINVYSYLKAIKDGTVPVSPLTSIDIDMNSRDMGQYYEDDNAEIVEKVFCMLL